MPTPEKQLFEKFEQLAQSVKRDFKTKGLIIPSRCRDGSIQVGSFFVVKKDNFYVVNNSNGHTVIGPLNLAQTAILVANDLALERWADDKLLHNDRWYGYKFFTEQAALARAERARKDKDPDRAELSQYKALVAAEQKMVYKKDIDSRFNKLCKLT